MTTTKKTLLAAALLTAFGASSAQAAFIVEPINVYKGDGSTVITQNATAFDWNQNGSGVAIGMGPFGDPTNLLAALVSGTPFDFLYQANLVNFTNGSPTAPTGLKTTTNGSAFGAGQYEITTVSRLQEKVTDLLGPTLSGNFVAEFTPVGGTFSIFFDDGTGGTKSADTVAGTGFDDGVEIARFSINVSSPNNVSTFTAKPAAGTGGGTTVFDFNLGLVVDFVNPNYLVNVPNSAVVNMQFNSNLNYPPQSSSTNNYHIGGSALYPNYVAGVNDLNFRVDAASEFNSVPEPGSLALFGIGLIGAACASRRRKSVA